MCCNVRTYVQSLPTPIFSPIERTTPKSKIPVPPPPPENKVVSWHKKKDGYSRSTGSAVRASRSQASKHAWLSHRLVPRGNKNTKSLEIGAHVSLLSSSRESIDVFLIFPLSFSSSSPLRNLTLLLYHEFRIRSFALLPSPLQKNKAESTLYRCIRQQTTPHTHLNNKHKT